MDFFKDVNGVIRSTVRLHSIRMKDYRNIEDSTIVFPNSQLSDIDAENPSILGLYGQNGSGKTSVIMALGLLKKLLSGESLSNKYASCIRKGADRATLVYELCGTSHFNANSKLVTNAEKTGMLTDAIGFYCFEAVYQVDLVSVANKENDEISVQVENEQFSLKLTDHAGNVLVPKQVYVDCREIVCKGKLQSFGSRSKYKMLVGDNKEIQSELYKAKAVAKAQARSFLFSSEFFINLFDRYSKSFEENEELTSLIAEVSAKSIGLIQAPDDVTEDFIEVLVEKVRKLISLGAEEGLIKRSLEEVQAADEDELMAIYQEFVKSDKIVYMNIGGFFWSAYMYLVDFAIGKLHVVDTFSMGVINLNEKLPLMLRVSKFDEASHMQESSYQLIDLNMDSSTLIDNESYTSIVDSVNALSSVLSTVIPELSLEVSDHGVTIDKDNKEKRSIDIIATRDGVRIPLKYESDGIRRLVSILSPMVGAYNDPSVMLAVDEIDSGLFEFLLGEILQIMASSSKGQLVFTSHNLRPLEVIPSKYLAFTTSDPQKRFTTISNRGNSNLRDTYVRKIVLGSKKEEIYRPTDTFEIKRAFLISGV